MVTLPKWNPAICRWNGACFPHCNITKGSLETSDSRSENAMLVCSANTRAHRKQAADLAAYANKTKEQRGYTVAWKFVSRNFLSSAQINEIRMNLRKTVSYAHEASGSDSEFVNAPELASLPYPSQIRIANAEVSDER